MTGSPLASAQCHVASSTVTWMCPIRGDTVFGPAALAVSPRVGHIHVTVDDATWHWADASGEPVIIMGLAPGRHKILIELVNANHRPIDQGTVQVTVPAAKSQ